MRERQRSMRRRVSTEPKPNHARSRNYIRLRDNCVKWKLHATETSNRDWFHCFNCVQAFWITALARKQRGPMYHELPL